jgi:hypothetical protein
MKSTEDFWNIIGTYNLETVYIQVVLSILLIGILVISFFRKNRFITLLVHTIFGTIFLFVGVYFFLITDKSHTAMIFGPLFILIGCLFLYGILNPKTEIQQPTKFQFFLYALALSYPLISLALNHHYPQQVWYILPCPIASLALITVCRFNKRNDLLSILLIIWGLTGVKAFIFDVKEDLILLIIGIYGLIEFVMYKRAKTES